MRNVASIDPSPAWHERQVAKDASLISDMLADGERLAEQRAYLKGEFLALVRRGQMHEPAHFARDGWKLADVLDQSLDYSDGPSLADAFTLLIRLSKGEWPTDEATQLLERMADKWADMNATLESI